MNTGHETMTGKGLVLATTCLWYCSKIPNSTMVHSGKSCLLCSAHQRVLLKCTCALKNTKYSKRSTELTQCSVHSQCNNQWLQHVHFNGSLTLAHLCCLQLTGSRGVWTTIRMLLVGDALAQAVKNLFVEKLLLAFCAQDEKYFLRKYYEKK